MSVLATYEPAPAAQPEPALGVPGQRVNLHVRRDEKLLQRGLGKVFQVRVRPHVEFPGDGKNYW